MIRAALVGTVAALSLMAGAIAARAADAIVEAPSAFNWTGAYIGGQIGGAFGHENDDLSDRFQFAEPAVPGNNGNVTLTADDFSMNGFVGGVYGGVNYQMPNNVVLGVEGDFNGSNFDGSHDFDETAFEDLDGDEGFTENVGTLKMDSDWQASIRGRLGYAMDRTLFYGTAGVAFTHAKLSIDGRQNFGIIGIDGEQEIGDYIDFEGSDTQTLVGYTVGLGIEHAFTDHWIGKLEGRYSDFGSKTFDLGNFVGDVKADFNQGQVLVGISYKF